MLPGILSNVSQIHDNFTKILEQSNYTIEVRGPKFSKFNFILTSDPENIHYILSTKFSNFNKGEEFKDIFEPLGDGIIAAESNSWKMQRRLIHSIFSQKDFLNLLEETSAYKVQNGFFNILDQASELGIEVEMQDLCERFTFDVTCIFLLGMDFKSLSETLPDIPFGKALDDIEEVLLLRHLQPRALWRLQQWLNIGVERKATRALKLFDDFIYHQISLNKQLLSQYKYDMISIFLREMESSKRSDMFLRDSILNLLAAGRDTSAVALSWFFYLVAINPIVESKLLEELEVTFQMKPGEPWKFPSFSELNKLIYLHATLCETLRLYPPVPFNHKASIKQDILPSGHQIGHKTRILFSIYAMGRMQELWGADARVFRPERWITEMGSIIDIPSFKYNVFSAGPRTCVGKDLAFREMKIVAAAVIWRYSLRIAEGGPPIKAANSIILHMKHGLKLNICVRTNA